MKCREAAAAGVRHLHQNRLRAGLSILGICIGVASVFCMMALGDGAKQIIVDDIEKFGGMNQVRFSNRHYIYEKGRRHYTRERLTVGDALAIEAACPGVLSVLPYNDIPRVFVVRRDGSQAFPLPILDGVTADYAPAMGWEVETGRFFSEADIVEAKQVCVLGAKVASELFGDAPVVGEEVKVRYHLRHAP